MAKVSLSSCIRRCHQNKLLEIVCMEFLSENRRKAAGRASEPARREGGPRKPHLWEKFDASGIFGS